MSNFVHLHNHSDFSLLRASSSVAGLVKSAQAQAAPAIALTDDGNLFGALKFYKECKATSGGETPVKPIVGCDFFLAPGGRLLKTNNEMATRYGRIVLLAVNEAGYRAISRLSSIGYLEGFYYRPRIDREVLQQELTQGDVIALSGGMGGEIPQLISRNRMSEAREAAVWYQELLGKGNFYLEICDHGISEQKIINDGLIALSKELGIPLVAANDTYYLKQADAVSHDVLLCIGGKRKKNETNRFKFSSQEFYLKSAEEMRRIFAHLPEACDATLDIAARCNLDITLPGPLLPDFAIPEGFESPEHYLRHVAGTGLRKRYGASAGQELLARLDFELDVIIRMGFTGYFLIVWDFIRYAKEHGIPVGPGRGSGAGSIVAYSMEITDIDPIRYNLLFERFLNPERISMPDFDIDFCFERRQEVIDYVTAKYGKERVGQIITFGTLKPKAALKDVARALDISFDDANKIVKHIPDGPKAAKLHIKDLLADKLDDKWAKEGFAEYAVGAKEVYARGGIYKELFDVAVTLEGLSRHASTHAAGIVIGKTKLTDYVPLFRDPRTEAISTQFTMEQLEDCGLVKMDFLGLKTLTLIKNTEELIRGTVDPGFDIRNIADDDAATFKMLGEGKSSMIFQFESEGMQKILKDSKPTCIEDLIALNALYRPGPMENIPQYVDCKWGRKPITYPHPSLEAILKETYGVIVYQEQVMQAAQIMAGYSLGGADMLRRAMGKKKQSEMDKQRAYFIEGAAKLHKVPQEKANEIFDLLDKFAGYGFNKSHAAAYSVVAYQTAYLKANFPSQFMAANLTNEINASDKFRSYLLEARNMGLEVRAPQINVSQKHFTVDKNAIVFGLVGIHGIGDAVVDEILSLRASGGKFSSIENFLERAVGVNKKSVEILIHAGCFDGLVASRKGAVEALDAMFNAATAKRKGKAFGQSALFGDEEEFPSIKVSEEEYDIVAKVKFEKELLGNYFSGHPLDAYRNEWERSTNLDISRADYAEEERPYGLVALLAELRIVITKRGTRMGIARFEDYNGSIEAVFFAEALQQFEAKLVPESVLGLVCKVDHSRGAAQLIVDELKEPGEMEERQGAEIHVRLADPTSTWKQDLLELRGMLVDHRGSSPLFLHMPESAGAQVVRVGSAMLVDSRGPLVGKLNSSPRVEETWKIYPAMLSQVRSRPRVEKESIAPAAAPAGAAWDSDYEEDDSAAPDDNE